MVKIIVYNDNVINYFTTQAKGKVHHTGLIIGSTTPQKDVIVHLTPTPKKEEAEDLPEGKDCECGEKLKKKKNAKASAASQDELIDQAWISQHVKQVNRMLPGGLDVLGIFYYVATDTYNKILPTVREVMFSAFKPLCKDQQLGLCSENAERIQLQICPITQKFTCRTIDVSDYKSTAKPAEWKPVGTLQWTQLETEFRVDQWIPVSQDKSKQSLLRQIQTSLEPLYADILNATFLFDDRLRPPEETLVTLPEGGKKGKQTANQMKEMQRFKVDIFLPLSENNNVAELQITDCGASMEVCGTIHCRGFVHSKATVQEAIKAVQQDIIRSITARCEIQCEEMLLIDEEQEDPTLVHELPRRVFAQLPGQDLTVSDYVYGGDSARDSLDAFLELLNLHLQQEDIDTSFEQSPACHELNDQDMEERLSEAGEQVMEAISSRKNIIVPLVSAAVVAAATATYYLLSGR